MPTAGSPIGILAGVTYATGDDGGGTPSPGPGGGTGSPIGLLLTLTRVITDDGGGGVTPPPLPRIGWRLLIDVTTTWRPYA